MNLLAFLALATLGYTCRCLPRYTKKWRDDRTMEQLGIGYETVDSKPWQAAMLGAIKGSPALKKASMLRGMQMFPAHAKAIKEHGDADSLLMAQYYHNQNNQ